MKKTIVVSFLVIFFYPINAQETRINAIPYTEYNFGENGLNGSLTILGWSRDGKIIYEYSAYNLKEDYAPSGKIKRYEVFDLVNDNHLYPQFEQQEPDYLNEENHRNREIRKDLLQIEQREPVPGFVENVFNRQWVIFLTGRYMDYNILPVVSSIMGQFPYKENADKEYTISITNIDQSFNGNVTYMEIIIHQNFYPYYSKNIGRTFIAPIVSPLKSGDWDLIKRVGFFYIKSPFENRIAVIMAVPDVYNSSGDIAYTFQILGCHLDMGFTGGQ